MANLIDDIVKTCSLETRLNVINEMAFMTLITDLGFRDRKMWTPEEADTLHKLLKSARETTKLHIEAIREWEVDGKPE